MKVSTCWTAHWRQLFRIDGTAMSTLTFWDGTHDDAKPIHRLITDNLEVGHLLPRTLADVTTHAPRFVVAELDGTVIACAELAPLSPTVAEVRSLVVDEAL